MELEFDLRRISFAMLGLLCVPVAFASQPTYTGGHADMVAEYLTGPNRLELKLRFDGNSVFEDGSSLEFQIVDPESVAIRVPDPPVLRESGSNLAGAQWDFIGAPIDTEFWFLPQINDVDKPFLGIATDTLPFGEWSGPIEWSLREVLLAPPEGEVSLWQANLSGTPTPLYSSVDGIDAINDSFARSIGGHDHYGWGFTQPGVYHVVLGANATHTSAGMVDGVATYTFLVGDDASLNQPGDYNSDGVVNLADYTVWRDNLGAEEESGVLGGNGNGGLVDASDYLVWKDLFGTVYSSNASISAQAIPEPSAVTLVIFGHAILLGVARRVRRRP